MNNEVICRTCQETFVEYIYLHDKLVHDLFSRQNISKLEFDKEPPPDDPIEMDDPSNQFMLDEIILVESDHLPSADHEDALHGNNFNVEIESTLGE